MPAQVETALVDVGLVVTSQNKSLAPRINAWAKSAGDAADLAGLVPAVLDSDAHEAEAVDACKIAADLRKEIDAARKTIVQPFLQFQRVVNGTLGSLTLELKTIEEAMKLRVLTLRRKREAARLEAEEAARVAAAEAAERNDPEPPAEESQEHLAAPTVARGSGINPGKMGARKIMRFRITDFAALPDDYKVVDEPLLRIAAKKSPLPAIPGVEFYEDETMTIT